MGPLTSVIQEAERDCHVNDLGSRCRKISEEARPTQSFYDVLMRGCSGYD